MRRTLLGLFMFVAANIACAADWRSVTIDENSIWFIDSSSLVSVASSRTGWVKVAVYKDAVTTRGMRSSMVKYAAHCKSRQIQILSWAIYNMDGSVKDSSRKTGEARDVIPESMGEAVYDLMCGSISKLSQQKKVDNPIEVTDVYFDYLKEHKQPEP